jgi:hypothetical protein
MGNQRVNPTCTFEKSSADDILDGVRTLDGRYGHSVLVGAPGVGPDALLNWGIQEVIAASNAQSTADRARLCTNAILNARRALACLVDWYLDRDIAKLCRNPPATPKQQSAFLTRRGIIDELTSHVLERAIEKRNQVEHEYVSPGVDTAEDVVELLRRTIFAIQATSAPSAGPWIFGTFPYSVTFDDKTANAEFYGWSGPLVIFSRFPPRPWVGILLPDAESSALVRQAFLDETDLEELTQLLSLTEQKFGHPSSSSSTLVCEALSREMGLL